MPQCAVTHVPSCSMLIAAKMNLRLKPISVCLSRGERRNREEKCIFLKLGKKEFFVRHTHVCETEKRNSNRNRNNMTIAPRSPPRSVLVVVTPVDMCTHACTTCCCCCWECGDCLCLIIYRSLCEPYQELKLRLSAQCGAAVLVLYQVASFNLPYLHALVD